MRLRTIMPQNVNQRARANRALDAANFFLADVRDGLGPYLAIYLLTEQKWDEAHIGAVMSVATIAGIVAQTPAGALVDETKAKRIVMVVAAIALQRRFRSVPARCIGVSAPAEVVKVSALENSV